MTLFPLARVPYAYESSPSSYSLSQFRLIKHAEINHTNRGFALVFQEGIQLGHEAFYRRISFLGEVEHKAS